MGVKTINKAYDKYVKDCKKKKVKPMDFIAFIIAVES
jgi:hypothetical protein